MQDCLSNVQNMSPPQNRENPSIGDYPVLSACIDTRETY